MTSIVTVTYNSYECLRRLRASLKAHTSLPYQWVIADNASQRPETMAELRDIEAHDEAIVVRLDDNLMFTRGTNAGLRKAGCDPIVLLNPDCEVTPGWLEALRAVAAQPRVGIVGAVLVDERGIVAHAGAHGTGQHEGQGERYTPKASWAKTRRHEEWVTGACLLVTRPALEAVGGKLDTTHRHYHSDRQLCKDVRAKGYEIWMCGHVIVHSVGGSGR